MAARMRKTHQEDVRKKIQVSAILSRLQKHLDGQIELSATQIKSAQILLDKSIANAPSESNVNMNVEGGLVLIPAKNG